jgi:ABC-type transport system involved in multi-copper enzyme maturation permease subunit
MSAAIAQPGLIDITSTPRVPFSRLVRVELRKMVDTRAGMWLLISTGLVTALVMLIQIWVGTVENLGLTYRSFAMGMNTPMGIFLPVLGIMSVTSEWGQRTALTTFALEPSRSRLIAAKFANTLILAVAAVVIGMGLGVVANVLYGAISGETVVWNLGLVDILLFLLLHAIGLATGFAFGTLFLNTAAAIVLYFVYSFVLPGLFELGAALIGWFGDIRPWVDFGTAQGPLVEGNVTGEQWSHLFVSSLVWFFLPLALGLWRVLRAEVK